MYSGTESDTGQPRTSAWTGWIYFAAVVMVMSGFFSIIWGITGIARDEVFVASPKSNLVIGLDYTAWGWIQLIGGIIVVLAGLGLLSGAIWAAAVTVAVAVLSAVGNLFVIGAYPVWSVIVIALDVLVIYAITVHGDAFLG